MLNAINVIILIIQKKNVFAVPSHLYRVTVPGFKLKLVNCLTQNQLTLGFKSSTVPVKIFIKKIHQAVLGTSYPQQFFTLCYMRVNLLE